jgi:hypothetical protein
MDDQKNLDDWKKKWMSTFSSTLDALPSGKRLHNYGKSPFLMGKSTINGHYQ